MNNKITLHTWLKMTVLVMAGFAATCASAQQVTLIKIQDIEALKASKNDTVYVVNFWATWCKPCVEELPDFERLHAQYKDRKVKVILVSVDFKKQIYTRLKPFILKNKIQSEVVFMDETNPNDWINKVDPSWSGAIPATLFISGKKKTTRFHEGETNFAELEKTIEPLIEK